MSELKLYQSIKKVHAQPLTDVAFNEYISALYEVHTLANIDKVTCGFKRVDEANPIEGYLVIYQKDQPNQYISWCPKAEFEEGNIECDMK